MEIDSRHSICKLSSIFSPIEPSFGSGGMIYVRFVEIDPLYTIGNGLFYFWYIWCNYSWLIIITCIYILYICLLFYYRRFYKEVFDSFITLNDAIRRNVPFCRTIMFQQTNRWNVRGEMSSRQFHEQCLSFNNKIINRHFPPGRVYVPSAKMQRKEGTVLDGVHLQKELYEEIVINL